MSNIKPITTETEQKKFQELAKYCFFDTTGWTEKLFPLKQEKDYLLGYYKDETELQAGIISVDLVTSFFGQRWDSSGISCVTSDPGGRNSGCVRQILSEIIKTDWKLGKKLSFLYPFLYSFYAASGYGYLTEAKEQVFAPEDIRLTKKFKEDSFVRFYGKDQEYETILSLYTQWADRLNGGIISPNYTKASIKDSLESNKNTYLYVFSEKGKAPSGFIQFSFRMGGTGESILEVQRLVTIDNTALHALMNFLWRHRGQCEKIKMYTSCDFPLQHLTNEPRISQKSAFAWMGRLLDAQAVLRVKAEKNPSQQEIIVSTKDPILEHNTGTYRIKGEKVEQLAFRDENTLVYSDFCSLVLGGISAKEAVITGKAPEAILSGSDFFVKDYGIFISEAF